MKGLLILIMSLVDAILSFVHQFLA